MDDCDIIILDSSEEQPSTSQNFFSVASPDVCQRWTRPTSSAPQQLIPLWLKQVPPPLNYQPQPIITSVISLSPKKKKIGPITIAEVKSLSPKKQNVSQNQRRRSPILYRVSQPVITHVASLSSLKNQRKTISNQNVSSSSRKVEPECIVLDDEDDVSINYKSLSSNFSKNVINLDHEDVKTEQVDSIEEDCVSNFNRSLCERTYLRKPTTTENLEKVTAEDSAPSTNLTTVRKRITPVLVTSKGSNASIAISQTLQDLKNACVTAADNENDMKKILDSKLDKNFKNCNPSFTKSSQFHDLLLNILKKVQTDPNNVYVHITELVTELKARKVSKEEQEEPPKKKLKSKSKSSNVDYEALENARDNAKVKKLSKTLNKLQKMIKKLECKEVTWEDDDDSSYIMLQRYKQRAVKVFDKLCEYTKESKSAGRIRKIHLSSGTKFPKVNKCVEQFVNSTGQFPDFCDILELLKKTSQEQEIELSNHEIEEMAKKIFEEVGCELQRLRGHGVAESLLTFLGDEADPADNDTELKVKLNENMKHWKKIDEVIDEFALKAKEKKDSGSAKSEEDENEEDEEEEEEDDESGKEEDDDLENIDIPEVSNSDDNDISDED